MAFVVIGLTIASVLLSLDTLQKSEMKKINTDFSVLMDTLKRNHLK